jgi:hypothetical protein
VLAVTGIVIMVLATTSLTKTHRLCWGLTVVSTLSIARASPEGPVNQARRSRNLKGSITTLTRFDVPRRPSEDDGVALSFLYLWRVAPSSWSASTR